MLIAVNYHYIRDHFDAPFPSIFGVTPKKLISQIDILGSSAKFLSLDDVVDIIDGRQTIPPKAVVISFDDGFREQFELAWPILSAKGIPAIFFVNTKPIEDKFVTNTHKIHILRAYTSPTELMAALKNMLENLGLTLKLPSPLKACKVYKYDSKEDAQLKYFMNYELNDGQREKVVDGCFDRLGFDEGTINQELYMTKSMVAELAKAHALGTHGHAHLPLGQIDDDAAKIDLDSSIQKIMEWTGYRVKALSYPFGFKEACSEVIADQARSHQVRFAFTMERAGNMIIDAPYFMARFSNNDVPGGNQCPDCENFWDSIKHAKWFREQDKTDKL
ncbi:polysaccharide deacetylase family protein [Deltaproteobacteria bacterium]|nr:polysaccharide deacetylase family protein [Deltaproteobacteria bacterium]